MKTFKITYGYKYTAEDWDSMIINAPDAETAQAIFYDKWDDGKVRVLAEAEETADLDSVEVEEEIDED